MFDRFFLQGIMKKEMMEIYRYAWPNEIGGPKPVNKALRDGKALQESWKKFSRESYSNLLKFLR